MEWKLVPVKEVTPEMIEAALDNRASQPPGTLPGSAMRQMFEAMVEAAPSPPEVEPVKLVRYCIKWQGEREPVCVPMNDGYWTPWHIADKFVNASPPSPKASWDADGNPTNLEAAARDFIEYMNAEDADRNPPQILAFLKNHEKNLRKFLPNE